MTITRNRIDIRNTSGVKVAEITDYLKLSYILKRNQPGECVFTVSDRHDLLSVLGDDYQIQVYRLPLEATPGAWVPTFAGLYRAKELITEKSGTFTAYCSGLMDVLNDRIVAYPPNSVNRSTFTSKPAETILHTLFKYNCTSSATTVDGRVRAGAFPNITTIPADSARGPTVPYWECAERTLLDTMYDLATQYKVAFTVAFGASGTIEWSYVDTIDKTAEQVFSLDRGNVARVTYKKDRRSERTVAIVGSTGEGTLKNYDVRTGSTYNVTTNNREMYVNTGTDNLDEIYMEGDTALSKALARDSIVFEILQTSSSRYNVDFDLNYKVTGRYNGVDYQLTISEIVVTDEGGQETVNAILEDL